MEVLYFTYDNNSDRPKRFVKEAYEKRTNRYIDNALRHDKMLIACVRELGDEMMRDLNVEIAYIEEGFGYRIDRSDDGCNGERVVLDFTDNYRSLSHQELLQQLDVIRSQREIPYAF